MYIHDPALSLFPDPARRRWRRRSLLSLDRSLRALGNRLHVFTGSTREIFQRIARHVQAEKIYAYRGLTGEERALEELLSRNLSDKGLQLRLTGFDMLFPPDRASEGRPFPWKVFTPYYRFCRNAFLPETPLPAPSKIDPLPHLPLLSGEEVVNGGGQGSDDSLSLIGFEPGEGGALHRFREFLEAGFSGYASRRDCPGEPSTSRLSPHLSAGEIGVRDLVRKVGESDAPEDDRRKFLEELGWREFSAHLLFYHPEMPNEPLREEFAAFEWNSDEAGFLAWGQGQTGIPFVDAGMRELAETGWMHNRARMVAASFLVKNLGISWQAGERWFAEHLLDFDPANNAASWQWVAGCGTDAAPFFRIVNPVLQGQRHDPFGRYVRHFIPELASVPDRRIHTPKIRVSSKRPDSEEWRLDYPEPLVDLSASRKAALRRFGMIRRSPSPSP